MKAQKICIFKDEGKMTRTKILAEIKKVARIHISDAKVMLFGSQAKGTNTPESDYDVLIISGNSFSPQQKISLRTAIRKKLLEKGIRSDILIQSISEVDRKKDLPGHIIRNILKDSVLL
jgi:predicted nucleotidyltransferase